MLNFRTIKKNIYISKAPSSEHVCQVWFQLGQWFYTEEDWNVKCLRWQQSKELRLWRDVDHL